MNSEETMMITFITDTGEHTLILPTTNWWTLFEDTKQKVCELVMPIELDKIEDDVLKELALVQGEALIGVYIDFTNDPTPNRAATVVSLGYYSNRVKIIGPILKTMNPLTLQSALTKFQIEDERDANPYTRFKRPLRRPGNNSVAYNNLLNAFKTVDKVVAL